MKGASLLALALLLGALLVLPGCGGDGGGSGPPDCDLDGDGVLSDDPDCGGTDCDDTDPSNYPGNEERCYADGDNDCDAFDDGEDAECHTVVLRIQAGRPTSLTSNVREYCSDVAQLEFEHDLVGSPAVTEIYLEEMGVSWAKSDPADPGSCPASHGPYALHQLIPPGGTLWIDNFGLVLEGQKLLPPLVNGAFADACTATIWARVATAAGDDVQLVLTVPVAFMDGLARNPACPGTK